MAKHLFNYCSIDWYEDYLKQNNKTLEEYIKNIGADGIEQYVYKITSDETRYIEHTIGVHLNYWPYWMDFWLKKSKRIKQHFPTIKARNEYYGQAMNTDEWLSIIRRNIGTALEAKPEYLVWHVAEANNEEIFTYQFNYTDREVLSAAKNIFNAVADEIPADTLVLFENLWWPGLRLTDVNQVKYFFDGLNHKNVGIMLDTGHLMNTNTELKSEAEGIQYICQTVKNLGEYKNLIKGIHLNYSLSGSYQKEHTNIPLSQIDSKAIWQHITSIDQHKPFTVDAVKEIINLINPEYIVHELSYQDLNDMEQKVKQQIHLCR